MRPGDNTISHQFDPCTLHLCSGFTMLAGLHRRHLSPWRLMDRWSLMRSASLGTGLEGGLTSTWFDGMDMTHQRTVDSLRTVWEMQQRF